MIRSTPTLITAPTSEPVTLADAKAWLRIDTNDEDALISRLIATAREAAEKYTRRAFVTQTWKLTVDLAGGYLDGALGAGTFDLPITALYGELPREIALPYQPIQSITSVKTTNTSNTESTYSSSNYFCDTASGRLVLNDTAAWPSDMRDRAAMTVTYVAGYGDSSTVPNGIKTAILMFVHSMYEDRAVCDMPESSERLLRQFKIYG